MLIWLFFCLSTVASIIYVCCNSIGLSQAWKAVLVLAGCFIALNIVYVLSLAVVSLFISTKPLSKQSAVCRRYFAGAAGIICGYLLLRIKTNGKEKLPKDERFLIVCNHRAGIDPFVIVNELKKLNIAFISKPSNMQLPFLGRIGYGAGCLAIDRDNNREALKTINLAADYIRNGFCSIGIFPEGTRNRGEGLLPFRAGAFKIAKKAEVPVVIASLKGTDGWKSSLVKGGCDVTLDILEVIPKEKVAEMSTRELSDTASELIGNNIKA